MGIGTAIFLCVAIFVAFAAWASLYFGRVLREQTRRLVEESERIDADVEDARQSIRTGSRQTGNRFTLPPHVPKDE